METYFKLKLISEMVKWVVVIGVFVFWIVIGILNNRR